MLVSLSECAGSATKFGWLIWPVAILKRARPLGQLSCERDQDCKARNEVLRCVSSDKNECC
jgi:hypothetical protein